MPRRFRLFMDACVNGHLIEALARAGWDMSRAIDLYPEGTPDPVVFAAAAEEGRVFVTNDGPIERMALEWLAQGRAFRMIYWPQQAYGAGSIGGFVRAFDALAEAPDPFAFPIVYLRPRR